MYRVSETSNGFSFCGLRIFWRGLSMASVDLLVGKLVLITKLEGAVWERGRGREEEEERRDYRRLERLSHTSRFRHVEQDSQ